MGDVLCADCTVIAKVGDQPSEASGTIAKRREDLCTASHVFQTSSSSFAATEGAAIAFPLAL